MKTSAKTLDKCQVELTVTLDAEETKAVVKKVENAFVREAAIPGFRKGKVPVERIRREFATGLKQETEKALIGGKLADAIKAEGLDEVAVTGVKDVSYGDEGASFTTTVEVKPVFKLPTYKGLKIEQKDTKVSDAALAERLEALRAAYAKFEDAQDGDTVTDGDFVQIDYSGTVDGKPIAEVAPEAKIVASGTGFWTQVEEGRFLPELLDALKGMKAGETKSDIVAKFDKEAAPEGLKGAKASYTLTLKAFRRRILPTDAELAERAKAESFEKLQATTREQMEKMAVEQEAARRENEAVELLLKKVDFDVPQSQVRQTMDGFIRQLAERAQYSGLNAEYFEKNRDKILKDAEENATRQVRLWYVIDAIAKEEKLDAKPEDVGKKVMELILANAK